MAISIRDNLNPIVQDAQSMMVRNEVGQPGFTLTIDGKTVQAYENQTLLSVAVDNGITDIPNMCDDEKLEPTATCRMCLVHIEGVKQPLPSCTTPALPGMVVTTQSDELFHIRRTNLEMLLSDHNAYCQPPCQIDCPTHIDIPVALWSKKKLLFVVCMVMPQRPACWILHIHIPKTLRQVRRLPLLAQALLVSPVHTILHSKVIIVKFLICSLSQVVCCDMASLNTVCKRI